MSLMSDGQFDEFFKPYAGNVEGFYEAAYWKLSDELIKELVRRRLGLGPGDSVVDAGGGTGRWAIWMADELGVRATVADRSTSMLAEAGRNVAAAGAEERVELVQCDLEALDALSGRTFDAAISTYGVLSFLDDPAAAFRTLFRVLRPGGRALLMSHSLSNALNSKINRDGAGPTELRELLTSGVVRWAPHVPPLRVFTAAGLRGLASGAGFETVAVYGVTCLTQPGKEDFGYPYTEISEVSQALQSDEYFRAALELELAATEHPDWAERGVNLMIEVVRPG